MLNAEDDVGVDDARVDLLAADGSTGAEPALRRVGERALLGRRGDERRRQAAPAAAAAAVPGRGGGLRLADQLAAFANTLRSSR